MSITALADKNTPSGYRIDRGYTDLILPRHVLDEILVERRHESGDVNPIPWAAAMEASTSPADTTAASLSGNSRSRNARDTAVLCNVETAQTLLDRVKKGLEGRGERADMLKKTYAALIDKGPLRKLARPARNWRKVLDGLRGKFPNGHEVFNYIESEFLLAENARKPLTIAPIGLVGAPGVGKSVLAEAIAGLLQSPLFRVQVEISGHASALVGTELHWSNAGPGLLFNALVHGDHINPVIMLDELEKVPTRGDYPDLHKVLYGLLEQASARNFRDASLPDLPLDASKVRWIGTANSLATVPDAIQSRMRFFEIPALSAEQSKIVFQSIDASLRAELKLGDWPAHTNEVAALLAAASPRRMRIMLRAGYGSALLKGSRQVRVEDLPSESSVSSELKQVQKPATPRTEDLLAFTNVAALRAIELYRRITLAERIWTFAEGDNPVLH